MITLENVFVEPMLLGINVNIVPQHLLVFQIVRIVHATQRELRIISVMSTLDIVSVMNMSLVISVINVLKDFSTSQPVKTVSAMSSALKAPLAMKREYVDARTSLLVTNATNVHQNIIILIIIVMPVNAMKWV